MECFKNIIHYESTIIISLPCIQLAKLKSCSVWCFSEKKNSGGMGHFALPGRRPCPTYPLQEQKWQKSAIFWLSIFLPPHPPPHPPHPTPTKNNLVPPLENLVLRLVKIFSGVKIHAIWRLVLRLVKYSLE